MTKTHGLSGIVVTNINENLSIDKRVTLSYNVCRIKLLIMPNKTIDPLSAYTIEETAERVGIHPVTLRKKLSDKYQAKHGVDPFIQKAKPTKIFGGWRFMGANIHQAMGTASYNPQPEQAQYNQSVAGAAIQGDIIKNK